MRISTIRLILLSTGLALAGCDGGGGSYVAAIPPPPVTPTPTPTPTPSAPPPIIPAATTSQQFVAVGAFYEELGVPQFDAAEQLQVRYVASTNSYEVQVPHSQEWSALKYDAMEGEWGGNSCGCGLTQLYENYRYSGHFVWSDAMGVGYEVIGIATPASDIPITGSASYGGQIHGLTTETKPGVASWISGTFSAAFNFGSGDLSGSFSPIFNDNAAQHSLDTVSFADTVYSTGSTTFSGKFDTNLSGVNSFNGLFTGPNAQELIGQFMLPYQSPLDSHTYQASGVFIGKK